MKRASKQDILNNINIIDIALERLISLEPTMSGNFTHRCKCPSKDHKHGSERTSSLYIDSNNNNFYCFGCLSSSNVIDFYMICTDTSFSEAIKELGKRVHPGAVKGVTSSAPKNNFSIFLEVSKTIRIYIRENKNDILWSDKLCKRVDEYYDQIGQHDVSSARKVLFNVKKAISKRKEEL